MSRLQLAIRIGAAFSALAALPESSPAGEPPRKSVQENVLLFNGRDLSGWQPVGIGAEKDWGVEKGFLVCRGRGHTWLRSRKEFGDFNLRLEYQITPGANSGVYVRVPANGNHHRESAASPPAGFEVQILDDGAPRHSRLKDYQYTASVYDIAGARARVSKPVGEWNTLEINCAGPHVTVMHNGVQVVDAAPDRFPLLKLRNVEGFLGLQSHNGVVRFRNLRIGPPGQRDSARADAGIRSKKSAASVPDAR